MAADPARLHALAEAVADGRRMPGKRSGNELEASLGPGAVVTFANALGADLQIRRLSRRDGKLLDLAPLKVPGDDALFDGVFSNHEFPWSPSLDQVFDGCVMLNMSNEIRREDWAVPVHMPLDGAQAHPQRRGYLQRLVGDAMRDLQVSGSCDVVLDGDPAKPCDASDVFRELRETYRSQMPDMPMPPLEELPAVWSTALADDGRTVRQIGDPRERTLRVEGRKQTEAGADQL
jgi:hypothetical protein